MRPAGKKLNLLHHNRPRQLSATVYCHYARSIVDVRAVFLSGGLMGEGGIVCYGYKVEIKL